MARAVLPWFRVYVEICADRKIRRLKPEQRWLWVAVMAAARESPVPGVLMVTETLPMSRPELANYADVTLRLVERTLPLLVALEMLTDREGVMTVLNFNTRQFLSTDNVTARTRAFRERSKHVPGNTDGTDVGTHQRQRQKTDTETHSFEASESGQRPVTLLPDPTRCTLHQGDLKPPPCRGCQQARESHEKRSKLSLVDARLHCPDCHGEGWLTDNEGNPTHKCDHSPRRQA